MNFEIGKIINGKTIKQQEVVDAQCNCACEDEANWQCDCACEA